MVTRQIRARLAATFLGILLGSVAACTPSTPAPTVKTAGAPGGPAAAATGVPAGWTVVDVTDPSLSFAIPPGWEETDVADYRSRLESGRKAAEGQARTNFDWTIQRIDDGIIKVLAGGPSTTPSATATVIVSVEDSGDPDADAAATRRIAERDERLVGTTFEEQTAVDLPIGHAVRVVRSGGRPGSTPSRSIEYIVVLSDGRTLLFSGGAPASDEAFTDLFARIAQTLHAA